MIHVHSEIAPLKKVIVHRPDIGIARISPKRAEELLFDDIVYLPEMQREHQIFVEVLAAFLGKENVLEIEDLLLKSLQSNSESTQSLISEIAEFEELPEIYENELRAFSLDELADTLITGYHHGSDTIYFDPIPNFIFTRDIAVSVKEHIIITKAAKVARYRENLLTRFIFKNHPLFIGLHEEGKIIDLNDLEQFPPSRKGEVVSIEGGDIMMLADDYLLVGCSERTTDHAFFSLKDYLFKHNIIKNVVQINIPDERSFMHIDTLFTRVSEEHVVGYKPIIYDGKASNVLVFSDGGGLKTYPSVREFFIKEINSKSFVIFSGDGESPFQEREQWTDGCNLVALKPGVAITYDRNPKTAAAFRKAGYTMLHAEEFLAGYNDGRINPSEIENTIITLRSGELSRARGGSHCMTCPIVRQ